MNLIEESFQTKQEKNKKRATTIVLVAIILVVIAIIGILVYMFYLQSTTMRLMLNGASNEKLKNMLVIEEDGTVYFPIKEVASFFGYESFNGEYTNKSEDPSKCYVKNENEVANFSLGSEKIYKLDLASGNGNYEAVQAKKPVIAKNGVLYGTSEAIEKGFNISFQYDQEKNRIYIYTVPYLVQAYTTKVLDYGYTEISDVFANQKALLQDMIVVEKEGKGQAVIDLEGSPILEPKYETITYLANIGDFLVQTNGKFGILSSKGETKVQIMYDSIELMDSEAGLYVAEKDKKFGVLDLRGNIKIYIENDEIGMDISKFADNNIKNKYVLVNNLIPARRDKLWGLYDLNGNLVVDFNYDNFGYIATSNKNALNLLVIPNYNVIVACKNKKYTLLNSSGEELFAAPVADDIYMVISGGKKSYYITANNETMNAEVYLDKIGVPANDELEAVNQTGTNNNTNNSLNNNTNATNTNTTNINEGNNANSNQPTNNQNGQNGNVPGQGQTNEIIQSPSQNQINMQN